MTTGTVIDQARPDASLIAQGDFGIVVYALLFVIGLLFVLYLSERVMVARERRATTEAMKALADALEAETQRDDAIIVTLSRIESLVGERISDDRQE